MDVKGGRVVAQVSTIAAGGLVAVLEVQIGNDPYNRRVVYVPAVILSSHEHGTSLAASVVGVAQLTQLQQMRALISGPGPKEVA